MGDATAIEWADATVNLWEGCTPWGPGCLNCYADAWTKRFGKDVFGKGKPRRLVSDKTVNKTIRDLRKRSAGWTRRPRIFAQSLSDTFDAEVADEWRDRLWRLIRENPWADWLLLTKRPENIAAMTPADAASWPNVWWIASAANQDALAKRLPPLMAWESAGLRGLSLEPLVGHVVIPFEALSALDWVIVGGESGPGARPLVDDWVTVIIEDCLAYQVPVFVKQLGARPLTILYLVLGRRHPRLAPLLLHDRKGGDWTEWPDRLRVREFPAVAS